MRTQRLVHWINDSFRWSAARLDMQDRPKPRVAAVEPIAADMVVPFVVVAGDRRGGPYLDDRTRVYLVDGFNRYSRTRPPRRPLPLVPR